MSIDIIQYQLILIQIIHAYGCTDILIYPSTLSISLKDINLTSAHLVSQFYFTKDLFAVKMNIISHLNHIPT